MDDPSVARRHLDDENLLAATVWSAELGAYEWELATDRVRWLNDWCKHHDLDPCEGELHGVRWRALVHPDDRARALREFDAHLAGERDRYEIEYRIRTRTGGWRWIRNRAYVVRDPHSGAALHLMGVCLDVDERKRLETELERGRRKLEALTAAAPIWMMLLDADGVIEFANRPILGTPPAALVGRPILSILPDVAESAAVDAMRRSIIDSAAAQMHTVRLADGRSIGVWATPVIDGGRVTGIACVCADLTERQERERDLLEAVAREQRRFAADLHDGLGQELTGIALLVKSLLRRSEALAPALGQDLAEILVVVNAAIGTSREVARGVSPVGREHGGLVQALTDLARRIDGERGPAVRCELEPTAANRLEPLEAENLFRIAQEAIGNAVRHADAGQVTVSLASIGSGVRLAVLDDGCGIGNAPREARGLGLRIMQARADLIGATLRVAPCLPRGTLVECTRDLGAHRGSARRSSEPRVA